MIHIDIDMPTDCASCWIRQNMGCKIANESGWLNNRRDDKCPLKEQEAEWIYGEEETGVDGYRCSECNFFEPWFYEFDGDIDFIKRYEHCPKCGRKMISYTGK